MTPYYDDTVNTYLIDGKKRRMTEEQAEEFQATNPLADVQYEAAQNAPLSDDAIRDLLECSCPPDHPDSNVTTTLCPSCRAYFANLED